MRRAFDHRRLWRTMSSDEASRRRVRDRSVAELGLPFYRAWSGGSAESAATCVNGPIGRVPSRRTAPEMYR